MIVAVGADLFQIDHTEPDIGAAIKYEGVWRQCLPVYFLNKYFFDTVEILLPADEPRFMSEEFVGVQFAGRYMFQVLKKYRADIHFTVWIMKSFTYPSY